MERNNRPFGLGYGLLINKASSLVNAFRRCQWSQGVAL